MKLFLTQTFQRNFRKLPKEIQRKVEAALVEISLKPHSGKKLSGVLEGEFSFRVGSYRIIYSIDQRQAIWIETVRHRREAYRKK